MKVLVTGATGYIGTQLCHRLSAAGHDVVAMYRNPALVVEISQPRVSPVQGDITSQSDLRSAMHGCEACFHLAALAKPWSKRRTDFAHVNIEGTRNVFSQASNENLKRVVFTSTASVFGPGTVDHPVTENTPVDHILDSDYERTKQACESLVREYQNQGLDIVTVYPSRVFGPGPSTQSNALTEIFTRFDRRQWRMIPGDGTAVGNYVYIDDVVDAHVRAMADSRPNERFLIGGENLSFNQLVASLRIATGSQQHLFRIPSPALMLFAHLQQSKANLLGIPPTITPAFARKYLKDWYVDNSKLRTCLGITPTPFADGLAKTIKWIRAQGKQ